MKLALILVTIAILSALLVEWFLRARYGFGNPPLYQADDKIGYLLAPNQATRRFGNNIAINRYSMRSPEFDTDRPDNTDRLFLIGDSVVNGNWWTDQTQTVSELLRQQLQAQSPKTIEVLNASANSWGPRNELAYLQRHGLFNAQFLILVINTDDLFATTPTPLGVGKDKNYPDRKPPLALIEAIDRLLPQSPLPAELLAIQSEGGDRVGQNLSAIQTIQGLAQAAQAKFLVILTPLLRETESTGKRDYEIAARQRLQEQMNGLHIDYIDALSIFKASENPKELYRDHIHLSTQGNHLLSKQIDQWYRSNQ
ncbi:MAG: SGNH/GDSL hydrolase family protein [Alkalinema sp. RU_4_3]|nr:SGNH/GDSL hydrolase family protein [Alkalinema sp. RU_4_3]